MKRLFFYMKQYRVQAILAPLFKMLEATFELLLPLIVAEMIDVGIANKDIPYLLQHGLQMLLMGVIGFSAAIVAQYFAAKTAVSVSAAIRGDLFAHITTLSYREIDRIGTSVFITRMTSDVNQVQSGINMTLRLLLRSPFVVFGAVLMACLVDLQVGLVFLIVVPVLLVITLGILIGTMPMYRDTQKGLEGLTRQTRENLNGVRVIRAFNRQAQEKNVFSAAAASLYTKQVNVGRISALLNPLTTVMINLGIAAVLWSGGIRVNAGDLSQGQVIALVNYMSQILVELIKMANYIITVSRAIASMRRIDEIFREKNSQRDGTKHMATDVACDISFDHVTFAYHRDGQPALKDISFHAAAGETIGIIGGTGSGKSTLVNLIPRFYDADQGRISINGQAVEDYRIASLREHVGIVPQKATLFTGTLRSNLLWGNGDASEEALQQAVAIAQASEIVESKGLGLDFPIEQEGRNLSGGQKQRITIARALVRKPQILILDDSASALDFATDARLRKAIRENSQDTTVFLVSQRVNTIRNADCILVLDQGQLAGCGTHEELLRDCRIYRDFCKSQLSDEEITTALQHR